jgi:hypothetical protein
MKPEPSRAAKNVERLQRVKLGPHWLMPVILTVIGLIVAGVCLAAVFRY